jgi:hypothetical protein
MDEQFRVDIEPTARAGSKRIRGLQDDYQPQQFQGDVMTTNQPIELGKVSEETKEMGFVIQDSEVHTVGPLTA